MSAVPWRYILAESEMCAVTTRTAVFGPQRWENACNYKRTCHTCSACMDRGASFPPKLHAWFISLSNSL